MICELCDVLAQVVTLYRVRKIILDSFLTGTDHLVASKFLIFCVKYRIIGCRIDEKYVHSWYQNDWLDIMMVHGIIAFGDILLVFIGEFGSLHHLFSFFFLKEQYLLNYYHICCHGIFSMLYESCYFWHFAFSPRGLITSKPVIFCTDGIVITATLVNV